MTFLFKHRKGGLQVRSTYPNPTMRDAVFFLEDNYTDKRELKNLIINRKVEVFAKIRDKTWQPMGILNQNLFDSILKERKGQCLQS